MSTRSPRAALANADALSLRGNFLALLAGRFFAALSMWLALVVVAKLSDPATVGVYALAQAICLPITEIARMGLRQLRASDTQGEYKFGDYLGLRMLATAAALLVMIAVGANVSQSQVILLVIIFYALTRCVELLSDMIYGLFQAQERMDYIARSLCLLGPLSLGFLTLCFWLTGSLVVAVFGQVAAHLLVLLCYDVRVGCQRARLEESASFWPQWHTGALRRLAVQALPLTFATALVMIALYLPRLMVEDVLGLEALGYFAAIMAVAMAPTRLIQALGTAASVRLAHYHATSERGRFITLVGKMVLGAGAVGCVGLLLVVFFGEDVLRMVYTEAYAAYANILLLIVVAATLRFMAEVLQFGMIAARRFWWLTFQHSCVAAAALVAGFSLIPTQGLHGAALTMIVIFGVQFVVVLLGLLCNLPRTLRLEAAA